MKILKITITESSINILTIVTKISNLEKQKTSGKCSSNFQNRIDV